MPPVLGVVAVAAYAANSVQSGAPYRTQSTSASEPSAATAAAGTAIRACPCRSTSRAVQGATTAVAASPVAVTAPASAYEPRAPAIMITALTLNMPMGSRAIRFPRVKARVPGMVKRRRYGLRWGWLLAGWRLPCGPLACGLVRFGPLRCGLLRCGSASRRCRFGPGTGPGAGPGPEGRRRGPKSATTRLSAVTAGTVVRASGRGRGYGRGGCWRGGRGMDQRSPGPSAGVQHLLRTD